MFRIFICTSFMFLLSCSSSVDYEKKLGVTLGEYEKFYNLLAYKIEWEINPPAEAETLEVTYFLEDGNLFLSVTSNPNYISLDQPDGEVYLVKNAVFYKSDLSKEERYKKYTESLQNFIDRYKN